MTQADDGGEIRAGLIIDTVSVSGELQGLRGQARMRLGAPMSHILARRRGLARLITAATAGAKRSLPRREEPYSTPIQPLLRTVFK